MLQQQQQQQHGEEEEEHPSDAVKTPETKDSTEELPLSVQEDSNLQHNKKGEADKSGASLPDADLVNEQSMEGQKEIHDNENKEGNLATKGQDGDHNQRRYSKGTPTEETRSAASECEL